MTFLEKIKNGESEILEFKENFTRKCIETAVAFSNSKGGTLLIGIDNKSTIKGCNVTEETLKKWSNEIAQNTEPTVAVEIYSKSINNKTIIVINFPEYPLKPVSTKGRCYRRVSASNKQMTPLNHEINSFLKFFMTWKLSNAMAVELVEFLMSAKRQITLNQNS